MAFKGTDQEKKDVEAAYIKSIKEHQESIDLIKWHMTQHGLSWEPVSILSKSIRMM